MRQVIQREFYDIAEFHFEKDDDSNIIIYIFNIYGKKIKKIFNNNFWNGKDDKDNVVNPGIYLYVIKNDKKVIAKGYIGIAL